MRSRETSFAPSLYRVSTDTLISTNTTMQIHRSHQILSKFNTFQRVFTKSGHDRAFSPSLVLFEIHLLLGEFLLWM